MFFHRRFRTPLSIAFAFVTTHNHFVLDRGGKVFNRSAPMVKLPERASEDEHLGLLGLLNSSTACFWMKQMFQPKSGSGIGRGVQDEAWENRYEFDGTKLQRFPIPEGSPLERSRELDRLARDLSEWLPSAVAAREVPRRSTLDEAHKHVEELHARMVALQEELDWECYRHYGLVDEDLTLPTEHLPLLAKGERAFEIVLARQVERGEVETTWFARHGSTPRTDLPASWPDDYRALVERRIALIASDPSIGLIERPEYKRRWNNPSWEELERAALRGWLLDRLEAPDLWSAQDPELTTTARLADRLAGDDDVRAVAQAYVGRVDVDLAALVRDLVASDSVAYLAAHRHTDAGLRKRAVWERVWDLQRAEDAVDARTALPEADPRHLTPEEAAVEKRRAVGTIPVPPKYGKTDFADVVAWTLRGKLDVPKERFVRYPGTRIGADTSPVVGWAGWDHLQRARALAAHLGARREAGADPASELAPLLAGLAELTPWLRQWHNRVDPGYGQRLGDFFTEYVGAQARGLGLTADDLAAWRPAAPARGRARKG